MRYLLLICALLFPGILFAQDIPEHRKGPEKPATRVVLVIDVSGSMNREGRIEAAVGWAIANIVAPNTEDMEIGVITFARSAVHHLNPKTKGKWFKLPSMPVSEMLTTCLRSLSTGGMTNPNPGLILAYKENPHAIVLITDGELSSGGFPLEDIITHQKNRLTEEGKPLPQLTILGVHPDDDARLFMQELANKVGGHLWIKEAPPEPVSEQD